MTGRGLAALPVAALALCLYAVPSPFFVEAPGPSHDVLPRIDIDGHRTYEAGGKLLLTTVALGRVNAYDALRAWLDPGARLLSEDVVIPPGQTDREFDVLTLSQMDQSKIAGVAVALRRVTDYPRTHGAGVLIYGTEPGTPAEGRLFPGDLLVTANDRRISDLAALRRAIARTGPGRTLRFEVEPVEGGDPRRVVLRPVRREGRTVIGIFGLANFPFRVFIESGGIAGPSAGLMWALGVVDLLTPGPLTKGRAVAGTGELDLEGRVHPVGGIGLKVRAAERAGATVFLVPRQNLAGARLAVRDMRLIPVDSLQQALRRLGGKWGPSGEIDG
jgi:PDZ domain-containing protein